MEFVLKIQIVADVEFWKENGKKDKKNPNIIEFLFHFEGESFGYIIFENRCPKFTLSWLPVSFGSVQIKKPFHIFFKRIRPWNTYNQGSKTIPNFFNMNKWKNENV